MSFSPIRLNHAVLFVADLDRSVDFYQSTFGMEVMVREPRARAAFLRLPRSGNHHDLGLFGVGTSGGEKRRGSIGLYHLAWQLDTLDELVEARRVLRENGAYTGRRVTERQRASMAPIPMAMSSKSCGCCRATPGASSPRRRRSTR